MKRDRSDALTTFTRRIRLPIRNLELLNQALTHVSSLSETPARSKGHYEALEFVGDAALQLVVTEYLFRTVPDRTPGEYSRMRASVVNSRALVRVARALNLAPLVQLGKGEEASGGRDRTSLLGDCVEAIIGALYIDRGWGLTQRFVERTFRAELERASGSGTIWDFKSRLQQYCQAQRIALPEFRVVREEGPDHRKAFEVAVHLRGVTAGTGRGRTKKEAEQEAAQAALKAEGQLVP